MTAAREAILLPLIFLTVALLAGLRLDQAIVLSPPSVFSLVLATMLLAALIRGGAMAPIRLLHGSRSLLANANGAMVLATLFAASSQLMSMLTPRNGLPMLLVAIFLLVLLVNTLVVAPPRTTLLRSLAVTLGSALLLKFVILTALAAPASRVGQVVAVVFDLATFGSIAQTPEPPAAGYAAFVSLALYLVGVSLLPRSRSHSHRRELIRR